MSCARRLRPQGGRLPSRPRWPHCACSARGNCGFAEWREPSAQEALSERVSVALRYPGLDRPSPSAQLSKRRASFDMGPGGFEPPTSRLSGYNRGIRITTICRTYKDRSCGLPDSQTSDTTSCRGQPTVEPTVGAGSLGELSDHGIMRRSL